MEEKLRKGKEIWVKFDKGKQQLEDILAQEKRRGSTEFLTNLHKENGGQVTFGDGAKGSVVGKGDLNVQGLPKLTNVLLVEGLKANLISISQLCDQNLYVKFTRDGYQCQYTRENTAHLSLRRLGHIHARGLHKLIKYGAVRGLRTLTGTVEIVCRGCMEGKQHRTPHPALKIITTKQPLELLHIDLMGPVQTESIAGKKYVMVCVDDFTRFTWVEFLREKSEAFKLFVNMCKQLMTEKGVTIGRVVRIRSDHGKEFENQDFANFCESKGISHEFSAPKTPQQNGIVERKNRTLQEMARAMINAKELPHKLWAEAVNTTCYASNRLRKFDCKSTEGIFVGYSRNSHAYRVFLKSANMVIETMNVELADQNGGLLMLDDEQVHVPRIQKEGTVSTVTSTLIPKEGTVSTVTDTPHVTLEELSIEDSPEDMGVSYTEIQEGVATKEKAASIRVQKNHPTDAIIGVVKEGMKTRGKKKNYGDMVRFVCYTSSVEPRKVEEALKDKFWIKAMQEE
ncbi:hypothetical protein H6P81_002862 [Aristolochia fimbriata]|uniref:Integrase catalytic domain-containing protein n=1 Tax=Aristolochia fimbriata TaxID=158543 RepID=A0AAV7FBI9_ARIFI|nr:hypothetical protein H6P81_002862 [Aristolochia fimbriata]